MVATQSGVNGVSVTRPVEEARGPGFDSATTQLPNVVALPAMDLLLTSGTAMNKNVRYKMMKNISTQF